MGLFDRFKKALKPTTLPDDHDVHDEVFTLLGEAYNLAAIKSIGMPVPEYRLGAKKLQAAGLTGKRIYQYTYPRTPVAIVPDPRCETPYSALPVKLAGKTIGYIKEDDHRHMKEILQFAAIDHMEVVMEGGDFKWVDRDGTIYKNTVTPDAQLILSYHVK